MVLSPATVVMTPGVEPDAATVNADERPEGPAAVCTYTCHDPAAKVTFVTATLVELATDTCDAGNSVQLPPLRQNHTSMPEANPVPAIVPPNGWFATGVVFHV
jgi:hypothetical protein